jgi:hypothetical protein
MTAMAVIISVFLESVAYAWGVPGNPQSSFVPDVARPVVARSITPLGVSGDASLLMDTGRGIGVSGEAIRKGSADAMRYFLTGLRLPNSVFWVNLRPDTDAGVIDPALAATDIGKIMLEADVRLKKDTARALSIRTSAGRKFWDSLYARAHELFGNEDFSLPAFTRVWIVPGEIVLQPHAGGVYVCKATMQVVSERDYCRITGYADTAGRVSDDRVRVLNEYAAVLVKELVLPELTMRINTSKDYADLRQVFYALILAQWWKSRILSGGYLPLERFIDSGDLTGLASGRPWSVNKYYREYRRSSEHGECVEEETVSFGEYAQIRTYFSGGIEFPNVLGSVSSGQPAGAAGRVVLLPGDGDPALYTRDLDYLVKADIKSVSGRPEIVIYPGVSAKENSDPNMFDGGFRLPSARSLLFSAAVSALVMLAGQFLPGAGLIWRAAASVVPALGVSAPAAQLPGVAGIVPSVGSAGVSADGDTVLDTARRMIPVKGSAVYRSADGTTLTVDEYGGWNMKDGIHNLDIGGGTAGSWAQVSTQRQLSLNGKPDSLDFVSSGPVSGSESYSNGPVDLPDNFIVDGALADDVNPDIIPYIRMLSVDTPPSLSQVDFLHILDPVGAVLLAFGINPAVAAIAAAAVVFAAGVVYYKYGAKIQPQSAQDDEVPGRQPTVDALKESSRGKYALSQEKISFYLQQWRRILDRSGDLTDSDYQQLSLLAKQLVNATSISPAIVKYHLKEMAEVQERIAEYVVETSERAQAAKGAQPLSGDARSRMQVLLAVGRYSIEYRHMLDFSVNLKLMSGYYLSPSHFLERSGIWKFLRKWWGIQKETDRSKRLFMQQLEKVFSQGNAIEPSLYPIGDADAKSLREKCADYFIDKVDEKNRLGIDHEWRLRRFSSRFMQLLGPFFVPVFTLPVMSLMGFPVSLGFDRIFISFVTGIGMSIAVHRGFLYLGRKEKHYREFLNRLQFYEKKFGISNTVFFETAAGIEKEYSRAVDAVFREVSGKYASTDVIVISTDLDQTQIDRLRAMTDELRGRLIRNDIPVVFAHIPQSHGGLAQIAGALEMMSGAEWPQLQQEYPHLRNRKESDIRVVCLTVRNADYASEVLPFPQVAGMGRPLRTFELEVANGYRLMQDLEAQNRGGTAVFFGDGVFVGPLKRAGDITLGGSWSSFRQMKEQKFGLMIVDDYSSNRVVKFYEKADLLSAHSKLEQRSLATTFDLSNQDKRQFLAFTGMMLYSFDRDSDRKDFIRLIRTVRDFADADDGKFQVNFVRDFLVPQVMRANDENIYTYLGITLAKHSDPKERQFYSELFDRYASIPAAFDIHAYVPVHHEAVYMKVDGSVFQKEFLRDWAGGGKARDGGRTNAAPGGIDFRNLFQPSRPSGGLRVPLRIIQLLRAQELDGTRFDRSSIPQQ